ncbi:MAG: glutamate racemase, partial [Hyphomicrobiaceae bacterium]|nr:glutamate racemase [Hyphomicrobiaceae bacterium]
MGDAPIGVFDSGIGGLTVLKELLAHLPGEAFVYFGDTARVPYGTKSAETVRRFSRENVRLLLDRGVKSVVVACNTASAEALAMLQREFALPIVGVIEPGVRAAVTASGSGKIGVIGTAGTIRSGAYQAGIRLLKDNADITAAPCPLFVPLAEEGWIDHPVTEMVAREYLNEFR